MNTRVNLTARKCNLNKSGQCVPSTIVIKCIGKPGLNFKAEKVYMWLSKKRMCFFEKVDFI